MHLSISTSYYHNNLCKNWLGFAGFSQWHRRRILQYRFAQFVGQGFELPGIRTYNEAMGYRIEITCLIDL
jgi:hypothetical protein